MATGAIDWYTHKFSHGSHDNFAADLPTARELQWHGARVGFATLESAQSISQGAHAWHFSVLRGHQDSPGSTNWMSGRKPARRRREGASAAAVAGGTQNGHDSGYGGIMDFELDDLET
jgi:hypothetical protein